MRARVPATTQQLLTAASVMAVLIGVMVYNRLAAARAASPKPTGPASTWVGRHIQHEGDVLGQVLAVEGDKVLVQKGATRLAFPRAALREQGLDLGLMGTPDMAQAERDGAAWKA